MQNRYTLRTCESSNTNEYGFYNTHTYIAATEFPYTWFVRNEDAS